MGQKLLAFALGVLFAVHAEAQSNPILDDVINRMVGTVSVSAQKMTSAGVLNGCYIEYNLLYRDYTYSQGRPLAVKGSFGVFTNTHAGAVFALKIVLADFDVKTGAFSPSTMKAHTGFLETSAGVGNAKTLLESHDSDLPGGRLFVFNFYDQVPIFEAIAENKVTLIFNRKRDGTDIRIPLDLTVLDTDEHGNRKHSPETLGNFHACVLAFFDEVQKRLQKSK